jgi:hypothetical protein
MATENLLSKTFAYARACFEYATDEDLFQKNPTRKLVMQNIEMKSCERSLSLGELRARLSQASAREHLVLRIMACADCRRRRSSFRGWKMEDFGGTQLRIDEVLKERMRGEDRLGGTKTDESDNYVPVPPDSDARSKAGARSMRIARIRVRLSPTVIHIGDGVLEGGTDPRRGRFIFGN